MNVSQGEKPGYKNGLVLPPYPTHHDQPHAKLDLLASQNPVEREKKKKSARRTHGRWSDNPSCCCLEWPLPNVAFGKKEGEHKQASVHDETKAELSWLAGWLSALRLRTLTDKTDMGHPLLPPYAMSCRVIPEPGLYDREAHSCQPKGQFAKTIGGAFGLLALAEHRGVAQPWKPREASGTQMGNLSTIIKSHRPVSALRAHHQDHGGNGRRTRRKKAKKNWAGLSEGE